MELLDYSKENGIILCMYEDFDIEVEIDDFAEYLKDEGDFYFETNEVINGQHVNRGHKATIKDYFNHNSYKTILTDLNNYLNKKHAKGI